MRDWMRQWEQFMQFLPEENSMMDPAVEAALQKHERLAQTPLSERMYMRPDERDLTTQERDTIHGALGLPSQRMQQEIRQIMANQDREWGKVIKADGQAKGTGMNGNINNYWGEKYMQGGGPNRFAGMLKLPDGNQLTATLSKYGQNLSPELRAYSTQRDSIWNRMGMDKGGLPAQFSPRGEAPASYEAEGPVGPWKGGATFNPFSGKGGQSGVQRFQWGNRPAQTSVSGQILPPGYRTGAQMDQFTPNSLERYRDTPSDAIPPWQRGMYPKGPFGQLNRGGLDSVNYYTPGAPPKVDPSTGVYDYSGSMPQRTNQRYKGVGSGQAQTGPYVGPGGIEGPVGNSEARYPSRSRLDINPQTDSPFSKNPRPSLHRSDLSNFGPFGDLNVMMPLAGGHGRYEMSEAPDPLRHGTPFDDELFTKQSSHKLFKNPIASDLLGRQPMYPSFADGLSLFGFEGW